jgi:hypothetical protein
MVRNNNPLMRRIFGLENSVTANLMNLQVSPVTAKSTYQELSGQVAW